MRRRSGVPAATSGVACRLTLPASLILTLAVAFGQGSLAASGATERRFASPIRHVVVLFQENHSFNDLLGRLCVDEHRRCRGSSVGVISSGERIKLAPEPDLPPSVGHTVADQDAAMNRGKMNGWDHVEDCGAPDHACLQQAHAGRVPTLWSLADRYVISDRTFESSAVASWGSHLELVAATMDGFEGDQPSGGNAGPGAGCDSERDEPWTDSGAGTPIMVPACVPDRKGRGPYRPSPVAYVPTIMDTLDATGLTWKLYSPSPASGGYGWAICPTFFECLGTKQAKNVKLPTDFAPDAAHGKLPNLSIVVPNPEDSQHNSRSLMEGDNWIAANVNAVLNGPDGDSTAIFITYDDCGCFYDPVRPPAGGGIRVPMVIVSAYAKPRFVDHNDASFLSILAFTEHTFGLPALPGGGDATAYDYRDAFAFDGPPRPPIRLPLHRVPRSSLAWLATHRVTDDDPT